MVKRKKHSILEVHRDTDYIEPEEPDIDIDNPHSRMITMSNDGSRVYATPGSPQKKKAPRIQTAPVVFPLNWDLGLDGLPVNDDDDEDLLESGLDAIVLKAPTKRYVASVSCFFLSGFRRRSFSMFFYFNVFQDAPLREWYGYGPNEGYREEYLHEFLRHEGLGEVWRSGQCQSCGEPLFSELGEAFKCEECFGCLLECHACCLKRHKRLPLHFIKVSFVSTYNVYQRLI